MNSQGKTVPSPIDWGNILDLLKPGNPQDPEIWATIRMKRAFDRISVHAQQNRGNNEQLDELNKLLEVITGQSKELAAKYPKEWENLGLKLCAVSGRFVNFFPSISKERKRWTLLDYLQNDIIRFYHFLDEHKINRRAAARKVMVFLLAHRNDDETALAKAVRQLQETECDSTLLRYFRSTLDSYQKSASSASIPERAHDFLAVTSNVTMKVKKESDMITVGSKPEGNAPGRLKVKRIRATAGKALSEPDKYLNLWLEKDLDNAPVEYKEPSGGVLAQALYPSGTPKPRLLQQTKDEKKTDIFHFSSINKFRNNLIHFGDIEKNPLYKIEDLEEKPVKLLGKPVTGLISMLITSCWFLRNEDFHGRNFGVVIEDGKTRFFIFDFDNIRFFEIILSEVKNEFLAAFNEGDMASLREWLKEEFLKSHIANSGQPYTPLLFKLIYQYSDEQIIEELQELISKKELFSGPASPIKSILLDEEKQGHIQNRLYQLKMAVEKFISIRAQRAQPVSQEQKQEERKKDPRLDQIKKATSLLAAIELKKIEEGIALSYQLACENRDNQQYLALLKEHLNSLTEDLGRLSYWETLGLKLCTVSPIFVDLFPTIKAEREQWTLLDHLQYDLVRFYYYSGESKDGEARLGPARKAMRFLLTHRHDEAKALNAAVQQEKSLDPKILTYFRETLELYQDKPSGPLPQRGSDGSKAVTTQIRLKVKKETDMITVGWKPGGAERGRLKVKRIRETSGKNPSSDSEIDKYLNRWLEKDLDFGNYLEPIAAIAAHTLYERGTSKPRLLELKYTDLHHSSINKFNNRLILAKDMRAHPQFNSNEGPGKLLGLPVTGLISLIATCWFLKNQDLNEGNFGVVPEEGMVRFFLIDFGQVRLACDYIETEDLFLKALESGNLVTLKEQLKKITSDGMQHLADDKKIPVLSILYKLIDDYKLPQIRKELQELISKQEIFQACQMDESKFLGDKEPYIKGRLGLLKAAVDKFMKAQPAATDTLTEKVYRKVLARTQEYVIDHEKELKEESRNDQVLGKKVKFFAAKLRALQGATNDDEMVKKLSTFVSDLRAYDERKMHRSDKWKRYLANILSTITLVPALGRMAHSYYKYDTIKFWKPQSRKLKVLAQSQLKKIKPE